MEIVRQQETAEARGKPCHYVESKQVSGRREASGGEEGQDVILEALKCPTRICEEGLREPGGQQGLWYATIRPSMSLESHEVREMTQE